MNPALIVVILVYTYCITTHQHYLCGKSLSCLVFQHCFDELDLIFYLRVFLSVTEQFSLKVLSWKFHLRESFHLTLQEKCTKIELEGEHKESKLHSKFKNQNEFDLN